jgi:hypothetical protein
MEDVLCGVRSRVRDDDVNVRLRGIEAEVSSQEGQYVPVIVTSVLRQLCRLLGPRLRRREL